MAPSTPPPPSSDEFAALTIASTASVTMFAWTARSVVISPTLQWLVPKRTAKIRSGPSLGKLWPRPIQDSDEAGLTAASPFLTDRDHEPIRIGVLRGSCAEGFLGRLNARHLVLDHPLVELVETRDTQARTASAGGKIHGIAGVGVGSVARVQGECRAVGRELGPTRRFEPER